MCNFCLQLFIDVVLMSALIFWKLLGDAEITHTKCKENIAHRVMNSEGVRSNFRVYNPQSFSGIPREMGDFLSFLK